FRPEQGYILQPGEHNGTGENPESRVGSSSHNDFYFAENGVFAVEIGKIPLRQRLSDGVDTKALVLRFIEDRQDRIFRKVNIRCAFIDDRSRQGQFFDMPGE